MVDESRFFASEKVSRIPLVEGDDTPWVEIKDRMSILDWERLEQGMMEIVQEAGPEPQNRAERRILSRKGRAEQGGGSVKGVLKPSEVLILIINITAWSFTRPLNEENLGKLLPEWVDVITEAIDARNPTRRGPAEPPSNTTTPSKDEHQNTQPSIP